MRLLDRYVLRNFLEPFLICFSGFIGIWLIFDLSDNITDFVEAKVSLKNIAWYYLSQLPYFVLLALPVGLLLALLYSLSQMSRRNEIIAMLTAGRSITRVLMPHIIVGALATAGCLALNWEWAPHAEGMKKAALEQITKQEKKKKKKPEEREIEQHLFRDRQNHRTWYIENFKPQAGILNGVHISQHDENGAIAMKWIADRAQYDPKLNRWVLYDGRSWKFDAQGDAELAEDFIQKVRVVENWSETPWRIASSELDPQLLSVRELQEYLKYNGDFPAAQLAPYRTNMADRLAFPWSCFVVVFIAAPLGIVFSRRGVLAGVASSLFIFFAMIMVRYLFLALGKGDRIDPIVAAWLPNIAFLALGLLMLYFRSTNRDLPKFRLKRA